MEKAVPNLSSVSEQVLMQQQVVIGYEKLIADPIPVVSSLQLNNAYGNLSWYLILDGQFAEAELFASKGLKDGSATWINTNFALSILLQGRYTDAELIYKQYADMLVRAGATNRQMVRALGVNIQGLYTAVFALGALLPGLAGVMASPIVSVQVGMGDEIILATFVVVVIGGVGSVKGAFVAGIVLGMFDTMLRAFLPGLLQQVMPGPEAQALGVGVSSMGIYLMMALVLLVRRAACSRQGGRA